MWPKKCECGVLRGGELPGCRSAGPGAGGRGVAAGVGPVAVAVEQQKRRGVAQPLWEDAGGSSVRWGGGAAAGALSKRCPGPWLRLPAGLALRVSTSGGAQEHR